MGVMRPTGVRIKLWAAGSVVAGAVGLAGAPALADVITFDGVSPGIYSHPVTSPYVEGIYSISAPNGLYYLGTLDVRYAGENNLFDSNYDDVTTLTTTNGAAFNLKSIDLAEMYFVPPPNEPTTFTGTTAGGKTVTELFNVDNTSPFATYNFNANFSDLTSVSWTSTGPYTPQFAHMVLSPAPEPASWIMLILGFLGLGATLRTRRREVGAATAA
jgi:hypothetical protein